MCRPGLADQYINPFKTGYFETGEHDLSKCKPKPIPRPEEKPADDTAANELEKTLSNTSFVL